MTILAALTLALAIYAVIRVESLTEENERLRKHLDDIVTSVEDDTPSV